LAEARELTENAYVTVYERDNFFIVTGCSGGGKSSIIDALKARGFLCVEEAGRQIVREQVAIGGDGTPWKDRTKFHELLLSRYVDLFRQINERTLPVFFDRALPELIGGMRSLKIPIPELYRLADRVYKYARKVFITPPWPEIFRTDPERRHSYEDALAEYRLLPDAYRELGYQVVEIPKAPVSERVDFILEHLNMS
jgi:predicted ATPase